MSVDYFWKRVPASVAAGSDPSTLATLVPYWHDDDFDVDVAAARLVGAEDTGALIHHLLRLRATNPAAVAAVRAFGADPADWDDDMMVGTLPPATVRQVAEFTAGAQLDSLDQRDHAALAAHAAKMGYQRPFTDSWADQVLSDTRDLATLLQAAVTTGEAVIVKILA